MAFDDNMHMASFPHGEDDHDDHHRNQHHSLSRLSICSNYEAEEDEGEEDHGEEYDAYEDGGGGGDADEELSDHDKIAGGDRGERSMELNFSDSDKEPGCHSLPATPPRRRRRRPRGGGDATNSPVSGDKAYASENEAQKGGEGKEGRRRRRRFRRENPPWVGSMRRSYEGNVEYGGGGGVVVVTRPIGGGKPLCMDLEEVKACKDLGFELEPGRVSYSAGSTHDTSSGGNSPVSNWRISSPGDDPKDVKARLKAWAQAVAFVSTSSRHSFS